jgi:SAM-dependent methyltransferase
MIQESGRTAETNARLWGARAADWSEIQEGQCRAVYVATFDYLNIGPGISYLDAGCGSGMAAQLADERGASVSGLDATENLISIARTRVRDGDFHIGDLESLPFADDTFDVVTGFNAFQYSGNAGAALAEAKRVAKPGARITIMTWGLPEGMEAASLLAALKPLLPEPPPGAPGPFALSEDSTLRAFATKAGLEPIEVFDVDSPWRYPDLATALRGLKSSGVSEKAICNSSEEAVDAAHADALAQFRQEDGSYTIGASFRCLIAHA